MRPPARRFTGDPVSLRKMKTPSRSRPASSSQSTATRWAAFSLRKPNGRGTKRGRTSSRRIRQTPATACPFWSLRRNRGGTTERRASGRTRKLTRMRRRITPRSVRSLICPPRGFASARSCEKPLPHVRRRQFADQGTAGHALAIASEKIVGGIAPRPRDQPQKPGEPPQAADVVRGAERGVRSDPHRLARPARFDPDHRVDAAQGGMAREEALREVARGGGEAERATPFVAEDAPNPG